MNKTVQDMKVERESKNQTKGNLEVKNQGTQTVTSEAGFTNRINNLNQKHQILDVYLTKMDLFIVTIQHLL